MIHSRVSWMCLPVDRSMTLSAPQRIAQTSFSTSSAIPDDTAELPMLALTLVRKLRPMIIGSLSGWLMLQGMIARPRAAAARTNSGLMRIRAEAPEDGAGCCDSRPAPGQALVLADGDVLHLRRDDPPSRVVHLGDVGAGQGAARTRAVGEADGGELRVGLALAAVVGRGAVQLHRVAALGDPLHPQRCKPAVEVNGDVRIRIRPGG